ncbi:MAG: DUF928 domain-containing protein [Cyanobacteria bacterium J06632_3]
MRHLKLTTLGRCIAIAGLMTLSTLAEPGAADSPTGILRQGLPGRRISGGSRSPDAACLTTPNQPVVALMPKTNLGLTLQEHPTFWFAIPGIAANKSLEFGLFDTDGNLLHQQNIAVPSDAGITSIALPETAQTLDLETDYRWYLSVVCDPNSRAEDLVVTGWVRRVQADAELQQQLATATPQEKLSLYESSELWFDGLTTLAELRNNQPSEQIEQQWTALFESVDLPQVLSSPFHRSPAPDLAFSQTTSTP